jgi:hypothetical protein
MQNRGTWRRTRGSFGSSLGCGTRMMGTRPLLSHLRPRVSSPATWGLSGSSKYRLVPKSRQYHIRQLSWGLGTWCDLIHPVQLLLVMMG